MSKLENSAKVLTQVLGLTYAPVGVKFYQEYASLNGFELPSERRYCQVLMGAREG